MQIKDKELKKLLKEYGFLREDGLNLRKTWLNDLQLNRFRLEKAAQTQATKFERWYSFSEDLSALIKERKRKLYEKEATLDLKIRRYSPSLLKLKYSLTSLKESAIKSIISIDPRIRVLKKRLIPLETIQGRLKGVLEAARQRKSMIKILSDLYISSYWDKSGYVSKRKGSR